MTVGGGATTFVTDPEGFVGRELVKVLVARGHQVFGLAPSVEAAQKVRRAGGTPVMGDLLKPGQWQDEAGTEWVFHLPPHPLMQNGRGTRPADSLIRTRVEMDAHLLDAVSTGATERVVYVADSNCYGVTGSRPITEDAPLRPSGPAHCLAPALDRLDGYFVAGLPVITALPGWVYGNGAWFRERIMDPILAGRRVLQFGASASWVSPIHVHDCARALVHLAEHSEPGSRYFLANSDPIQVHAFAETFARLASRPLKVQRLPRSLARMLLGPLVADRLEGDRVFSNIRLRGTGFRFEYPTLDEGLRQVLGSVDE